MMLIRPPLNTLLDIVHIARSTVSRQGDFDLHSRMMSTSIIASLSILCMLTGALYFISLIRQPDFKLVDGCRILAQNTPGMYYVRVGLILT